MARIIGPDEASRKVEALVGGIFRGKANKPAQLWADEAATVPADVLDLNGSAIPHEQPAGNGGRGLAPTVTIDDFSFLPLIQYPPDDVHVVYVTCDGGPAWPAYARNDDRLDALVGRLISVEDVQSYTISAKAFGARGDGVTDDAAAIQAAVNAAKEIGPVFRVDPDPYVNHDHRGVPVYLPAGHYRINSPIILPRSGYYRSNTTGLVGEHPASTRLEAGPSFPVGRGLIEWEVNPTVKRIRDQVIKNLTLIPKYYPTNYAIYLKLGQDRTAYGTNLDSIDTLYNTTFENLIVFGINQNNESLIRLEGRVDFCTFTNIIADISRGAAPPYLPTKLLHFDDFSQWTALGDSVRIFDAPGLNWSTISDIGSGFRGGWVTALHGRVANSIIDNLLLQGAAEGNPALYLRDSAMVTGRSWSGEGQGEDGIYTLERCSDIRVSNVNVGVTDLATPALPGSGIRLIDSERITFTGRHTSASTPAMSASNSLLVKIDANCHDIEILRFQGNSTFESEFSIDPAAYNIQIDYENIATGVRTVWGPPVPVGAYLLQPGHYMIPEGARTVSPLLASQEWVVPIKVGREGTIDRIGIEVTVAGVAGSLIRLGVRDQTTNGIPGALLLDAGTVAGDVVGITELPVTLRLRKPGTYWLSATAQGAAGTAPTVRAVQGNLTPVSGTSLAGALSATPVTGYLMTGVTGALPATYTVSNRAGSAPLIAVRAA